MMACQLPRPQTDSWKVKGGNMGRKIALNNPLFVEIKGLFVLKDIFKPACY